MKKNIAYIFVDDGYPEASDYNSNFVCYDPAVPGSFERAMAEVDAKSSRHINSDIEPTMENMNQARRNRFLKEVSVGE